MIPRRTALSLHQLGDRTLPSALSVVPVGHGAAPVSVTASHHPLHGAGAGTYREPPFVVDTGTDVSLRGHVRLDGLGSFGVTGRIRGVGLVNHSRAMGELVLRNSRGTIVLSLHGSVQPSFAPLPHDLVYSVARGTGEYQHVAGYGSIGVRLTPLTVAHGRAPAGTIGLTFS